MGITDQDGKHKIMEAGEHCDQGMQPERYGMAMDIVREQRREESEEYQENVSDVEMRLLHPKLSLNTGVFLESNSLDSSSVSSSEHYSSEGRHVTAPLPVILSASLLFLLRSL